MPSTVLLTGASSQLGVFLLPRLKAANFRVIAISRKAPSVPLEIEDRIRWQQPGPAEAQVRYLVSCGPLELACEQVQVNQKLKRVVAFSTSSTLTKADSHNRAEERQITGIIENEKRLKKQCEERDIPLLLIRPTLIYGCGLDRNVSLLARFGRRFGFIPVASNAAGLRQPVHADDLAAVAVSALLAATPVRLESMACGGSTLPYKEMAKKTAAASGNGVRILAISPWVLLATVRLASNFSAFRGINPEMVRRQCKDMTFDDSRLREVLPYAPRPFDPVPADFEIPVAASQLQLNTAT